MPTVQSNAERAKVKGSKQCERIVRSRKTTVGMARRAQMLVLAARGFSNRQIALELGANEHVVGRVRKQYGQRGLADLAAVVMSKAFKRGSNLVRT